MNKFLNFFTATLFVSIAVLTSCGSDDPVPPTVDAVDEQGNLIATGRATASSVKQGTVDATGWENFAVTFTYNEDTNGGGFTTEGRPAESGDIVWPASGTWTFGGADKTNTGQIVRSDNITMDVNATTSGITVVFTTVDPNGRLLTFGGEWTFVVAFP